MEDFAPERRDRKGPSEPSGGSMVGGYSKKKVRWIGEGGMKK